LLPARDVVALAGQQVDRANDRFEIRAAAEAYELALGESVLLEEFAAPLVTMTELWLGTATPF